MDKRLNTRTTERIEGLINEKALMDYKSSIRKITETMLDEGFDYEDIRDYLLDSLELHLYKAMDWISNDTDFYENGDPDDCDPAGGYGLNSHI